VSIERRRSVASAPSASATGLNGQSTDPIGVVLLIVPSGEVGEYCPCQAVDLVVEHEDLDVHVAAQRVDQMVAADRKRVPSPVTTQTDRSVATVQARSRSPARGRGSSGSRRSRRSTGSAPRSRSRR
jgi:hypothetical protein